MTKRRGEVFSILALYSRGHTFEFLLGDRLSWQRNLEILHSPTREMLGYCSRTFHAHFLPYSFQSVIQSLPFDATQHIKLKEPKTGNEVTFITVTTRQGEMFRIVPRVTG
jgi:hypothetical protein